MFISTTVAIPATNSGTRPVCRCGSTWSTMNWVSQGRVSANPCTSSVAANTTSPVRQAPVPTSNR